MIAEGLDIQSRSGKIGTNVPRSAAACDLSFPMVITSCTCYRYDVFYYSLTPGDIDPIMHYSR